MDIVAWLSLAGICALGAMSPGPSLLIILRGAAAGVRPGIAAALAHGAGVGIYAVLTALGLAVLITKSPLLFNILQWGGAAMLLYLGWKALRARAPDPNGERAEIAPLSTRRAAAQGFGIAFFNPKIAIFFTALFSQFVGEQQALGIKLGMAALAAGIDAVWYCLVTLAVSAGRRRNWSGGPVMHRLQQLFGILLVALAARLVLTI
ncbi:MULTISPECIES: LysE family translocator [Microbulbifer]|uniref:LysE family translocator n=1 Tax=Microbulbifer TaxID=48073 RepID=UPI001E5B413C|nr:MULTISPECIES: LysE family translocator [Microbulbifer]UHQ55461.1 LysE family translocator [Microbulbifer sp. YPW16]